MAPHHGAGKGWIFDVNIMRKEGGILDITVYRKLTHTDRYLHFQFHDLMHVKRDWSKCHYSMARDIILQKKEDLRVAKEEDDIL